MSLIDYNYYKTFALEIHKYQRIGTTELKNKGTKTHNNYHIT